MRTNSWLSRLSLVIPLLLFGQTALAQVTDDAFDVAQGTVVIDCEGVNCENVLGGDLGSVEPGNYFCPTGGGVGTFCFIDFETPSPVEITGIHFIARHDDVVGERRATDLFEFFADLNGDGDFLDLGEDLVSKSIAIPYSDEPDNENAGPTGNQLELTFYLPVTAMRWRMQVRWPAGVTGAGSDGPRIRELDALTDAPPCLSALTVRTGLLAAKDGAGGIRFRWDGDAAASSYHVNAVDSTAGLTPPTPYRAPVGMAIEACDARAPATSCTHVDAIGGPPLLFYQVVSACGDGGLEEGPLN